MRPMAVSPRILRWNCCRWRTVSATMSKSPASEPPTCRWIVTALMTNSKLDDPTRAAIVRDEGVGEHRADREADRHDPGLALQDREQEGEEEPEAEDDVRELGRLERDVRAQDGRVRVHHLRLRR